VPDLGAPASPPLIWLGVACAFVVAGLVIFFLAKGGSMGVLGWALAGPAAIAMIGFFTVQDAKRAQSGWYRPSALAEWGRRIVIGAAFIVVGLNAYLIAFDVARKMWR